MTKRVEVGDGRVVHRTQELAALEARWSSSDPRPAVVSGRRRVGETALSQRFAQGNRSVSHTGAGRAAAGELARMSLQAAVALPGQLRDLAARPYHDWDDALDDLASPYLPTRGTAAQRGEMVLATDVEHGASLSSTR